MTSSVLSVREVGLPMARPDGVSALPVTRGSRLDVVVEERRAMGWSVPGLSRQAHPSGCVEVGRQNMPQPRQKVML